MFNVRLIQDMDAHAASRTPLGTPLGTPPGTPPSDTPSSMLSLGPAQPPQHHSLDANYRPMIGMPARLSLHHI